MKSKKTLRRHTMIEKRQISIRFGEGNGAAQICDRCGGDSLMFTPEIVSGILRMPTREIYRRIEAGNIHFLENKQNQVLVCVRSLDQYTGPEPNKPNLNGKSAEGVRWFLCEKNSRKRKLRQSD